jgi:hypothetical protein
MIFSQDEISDAEKLMRGGGFYSHVPEDVIFSNYTPKDADIYYSFVRPKHYPDTMEVQWHLKSKDNKRCNALFVWDDTAFVVEYGGDGMEMGLQTDKKSEVSQFWPSDIGIKNVQDMMDAASDGSLCTNEQFDKLAKAHEIHNWF